MDRNKKTFFSQIMFKMTKTKKFNRWGKKSYCIYLNIKGVTSQKTTVNAQLAEVQKHAYHIIESKPHVIWAHLLLSVLPPLKILLTRHRGCCDHGDMSPSGHTRDINGLECVTLCSIQLEFPHVRFINWWEGKGMKAVLRRKGCCRNIPFDVDEMIKPGTLMLAFHLWLLPRV